MTYSVKIQRSQYVEVHQAGVTAMMKDLKVLNIYGDRRSFSKKLLSQDKGQKEMFRAFVGEGKARQYENNAVDEPG